jgi:arsenate reductase
VKVAENKPKILVLCTGNSCRSQMAEGYLRHFANGNAEIYSAGIETHGINPLAVKVMAEDGIDVSSHTSNNVNEYRHIAFDYVITVCDNAKENCPYFPSKAKTIHRNFPDPAKAKGSKEEQAIVFREVRDTIKLFCFQFAKEKIMTKSEIALETFNCSENCHYNCAQSVLYAFAEDFGLNKAMALKIACGFGAGMGRTQSVCGAVSGAIMVISLKYGENLELTYKKVREFIQKFKDKTLAIECNELLNGCNLLTDEGQKFFNENNLRQKNCNEYVKLACEILTEITND